ELLPEYLRFLRGVVDSEDLPLNISREMLQKDRQTQRMRRGITAKVLDALGRMRDAEPEKFQTFWREFGRTLKEGLFQDAENREKLLDLCQFASTADPTNLTRLDAYVDRMPPDQDAVYYLTGTTRAKAEQSPHIEAFREKGFEVLLLTDPVDEVWTQAVFEYRDKPFRSITKGAVELGSEEDRKQAEDARKEKEQSYASLLEFLKDKLADEVKDVRLSSRLTQSPACLVGDPSDLSPQLEQMMRALGHDAPKVKRILELNPSHPVLERLHARFERDRNDPAIAECAELLYGQALLAEGNAPSDPARFGKLVAEWMAKSL
ncbi:MAG TPA: molecular chaperone HtpG, partial [Candidatus Hydrogenedentes bacterium]|nr:molecular chaperone HtpG [Candidatus Hydrogenedentota bacterium]